MQKRLLLFSGFSGGIAVILGALSAHFLKTKLSVDSFSAFKTAAEYQMYHSIALLAIVFFADKLNNKLILKAAYCFMIGIVLFSGSLYFLSTSALTGINAHWLGPITPIGGLFFIMGWLLVAFSGLKRK